MSSKTESFIKNVLHKYPKNADKYDYSKVVYVRTHDKVTITCKKCGDFEQSPAKHLSGRGCPSCKKLSTSDIEALVDEKGFILLSDIPVTPKEKITISCKHCGTVVEKQLRHLKKSKWCRKCFADNLRKDKDYFLSRVPENNNYDYSISEYTGANNKLRITCIKHGIFETTPTALYSGKGCKQCGLERLSPFNKTIAERNSEEFKNTPSGLYLLQVGDFYKIGVAKWFKARVNKIKRQANLPVEVLSYVQSDQYSCITVEQELLSIIPKLQFEPEHRFDGYTECFRLDDDTISDLVEFIENSLTRRINEQST